MATRGFEHVTLADVLARQAKPSKYRNVKVTLDGHVFDSRREADYWVLLRARQDAGEISELRRQVVFPLYGQRGGMVGMYIADYVYVERGQTHVVDAKGYRTRDYRLKRRLLADQGITVEEV